MNYQNREKGDKAKMRDKYFRNTWRLAESVSLLELIEVIWVLPRSFGGVPIRGSLGSPGRSYWT